MIQSIQGLSSDFKLGKINEESKAEKGTTDVIFVEALQSAQNLLGATNEAEQVSSKLTYDFLTGRNENIHGLMIAQEKASILLQFTMQVRNQVLDAYREIMRMPV